eukprot:Gb_27181 [translate_table: standard]
MELGRRLLKAKPSGKQIAYLVKAVLFCWRPYWTCGSVVRSFDHCEAAGEAIDLRRCCSPLNEPCAVQRQTPTCKSRSSHGSLELGVEESGEGPPGVAGAPPIGGRDKNSDSEA